MDGNTQHMHFRWWKGWRESAGGITARNTILIPTSFRSMSESPRKTDHALLDTLLSKRSDDDQEMKIWRPVHFCVAATHGP